MARLPIPGSDDGTWGTVLNDYLTQSLDAGGLLKQGSVGSVQLVDSSVATSKLQNNSITTAKIADGSISPAKLTPDAGGSLMGIRSLLIFYSPPNIINAQYSDDYAAGILARYDDVVLGGGLEDPASPYYASTQAIISKLAAISPDTVVWGYINAGVTTGNLSLATLQTQIDQWLTIGAGGIFIDTFGYDYQTPRSRQNSILSYIHSKNIGAIINAWNADDALGSTVDATYNPSGTPTVANASDVLLLESWVCNSDSYSLPYYATISDIKTRGDKAVGYRGSLGIRIFAVNIMLHTGTSENTLMGYRNVSEGLARAWRLDGSGMAASTYSSSGTDTGVVTPRFSAYRSIPLRKSGTYILNGSWTQVTAPDLGIVVTYNAGTSTYDWQQQ